MIRVGDKTKHCNVDGFYTIRVVEIYIDEFGKAQIRCELNDDPDSGIYYVTYTIKGYVKRIEDAG